MRKYLISSVFLVSVFALNGCRLPYNEDYYGEDSGPECASYYIYDDGNTARPATADEIGDKYVFEVRHCKKNEYCLSESCVPAGMKCEGSENKGNDNGFGYCLLGSQCIQGVCQQASVGCTEADKAEVCGIGAECINGACKCGDLNCGGKANTCFKDAEGEGLGCVNIKADRDNCGTWGNKCEDGFICIAGLCKESCQKGTIVCDGKCVNPLNDLTYCGAKDPCNAKNKGVSCPPDQVCADGECSTSCSESQVICDGLCRIPKVDMEFCGAKLGGACNSEDPESPDYKGRACPMGTVCTNGNCVASCVEGQVFCNGNCIVPEKDANYCGATVEGDCSSEDPTDPNYKGVACVAGQACSEGGCVVSCQEGLDECNNICVNYKTDKDHCGGCQKACKENAQICVEGECVCPAGFTLCAGEGCVDLAATHRKSCTECIDSSWGDCDKNIKNGCEVNLMTDSGNCKTCGNTCSAGTFCSNGDCSATCGGGLTKCTVAGADACYNTTNDTNHCSACNTPCPQKEHATASCSASACIYTCDAEYTNCGTASEPNCINLNESVDNCNACGKRCAELPNVVPDKCSGGFCEFTCMDGYKNCNGLPEDGCEAKVSETNRTDCEVCKGGFDNCDGNWNNGCEINIQTDNKNCGACGKQCASGQVCSNGFCTSSCLAGQTLCESSCLSLTDMRLSSCSTCTTGYCDSDGNKVNGCEIQVGTSVAHCAACNSPCASKENATALCNSGTCSYICNAGYTNCGTNTEPNCINLKAEDANNCGICGYQCAAGLANVETAACVKGICKILTCKTGYANCDGSEVNGCEIDGTNNLRYCGATNTSCSEKACDKGEVCSGGSCGLSCQEGLVNCDGLCVTLSENVENCGSCGNKCGGKVNATPVCNNGACNYACNLGYTNCGSISEPKCTNTTSDAQNCGACGVTCGSGQSCVNGACKCDNAAQTNCNDVCKTLSEDVDNCGACGTKCSAVAPLNAEPKAGALGCKASVCHFQCKAGFYNCGTGDTASTINCVSTQSDGQHCGACNKPCPSGTACTSGICATSCPAGQTVCNGSCVTLDMLNLSGGCNTCAESYCDTNPKVGCETAVGSNANHCTACSVACAFKDNATAACLDKKCIYTCNVGYLNCGTPEVPNCVATASSSVHCGSCGNTCDKSLDHASSATCAGGVCSITCASGYANCDSVATNGCETSTGNNKDNCGGCGIRCENFIPANAKFESCSAGACTYSCLDGYTNCGPNNTASGIRCVDTEVDSTCCGAEKMDCKETVGDKGVCDNGVCIASNCTNKECLSNGACVNQNDKCGQSCTNCNTANNASAGTCNAASGTCTITACAVGYCFDSSTKSCINTSTKCGSGCVNCNTANNASAGTCSAGGTCMITACKAGYCLKDGSCIKNSSNEACGASCNDCAAFGMECVSGACVKSSCGDNLCLVDNMCISSLADNKHCGLGGPGKDCNDCTLPGAAGAGSSSGYCQGGVCQTSTCASGYCLVGGTCSANTADTSCGASCTNCAASGKVCKSGSCVCAANTCAMGSVCIPNTSSESCGASCTNCITQGKVCISGTCQNAACAAGQCEAGDGSCVSNLTTPDNCGNSCEDCTNKTNIADAYCKNGVCKISECASGYADVNKYAADGCEVNLNTNTSHCGLAGHACAAGETCVSGVCKCGSSPACASIPGGINECVSGTCRLICMDGFHKVSGGDIEVCVPDSDTSCGEEGINCSAFGAVCRNGACKCGTSSFMCNGGGTTRCCGNACVNTNTSTDHCGACNHSCDSVLNGTYICSGGGCDVICNPGYSWNGVKCLISQGCRFDADCPAGQKCCSDVYQCAKYCRAVLEDEEQPIPVYP